MSGPYRRLLCQGERTKPRNQTAGAAFFTHKRHPPVGEQLNANTLSILFIQPMAAAFLTSQKFGAFCSALQPLSQSGWAVAAD
jgi:hypothetical protein